MKRDIEYITHDQWLAERGKTIGASDAPIILGKSRWETPLQWYHRAREGQSKDIGFRGIIGHAVEPHLLDHAVKTNGWRKIDAHEQPLHVRSDCTIRRINGGPSPQMQVIRDGMSATIDGMAQDADGRVLLLEAKVVGEHMSPKWSAEDGSPMIPTDVWTQMRHQSIVTGIKSGFAVATIGMRNPVTLPFTDPPCASDDIREHVHGCEEMLRMLRDGIEPQARAEDMQDILRGATAQDDPVHVPHEDSAWELAAEIAKLDAQAKPKRAAMRDHDGLVKDLKAQLAVRIKHHGGRVVLDGREWYISKIEAATIERKEYWQVRSKRARK